MCPECVPVIVVAVAAATPSRVVKAFLEWIYTDRDKGVDWL
jgi:hypothetical protein